MANKLMRPSAKMLAPIEGSADYQTWIIDNDTTNMLTLKRIPGSNDAVLVVLDGAVQQPSTSYTVVSNQLNFSEYLPSGVTVGVYYFNRDYFATAQAADGSVTSAALQDGSVVTTKLFDGSVTSAKIAAQTIVAANLTADTVEQRNIINKLREIRVAPPTQGTYYVGDLVYNSNPSTGSYIGWVCIAPGTPGVWRPFGAIA